MLGGITTYVNVLLEKASCFLAEVKPLITCQRDEGHAVCLIRVQRQGFDRAIEDPEGGAAINIPSYIPSYIHTYIHTLHFGRIQLLILKSWEVGRRRTTNRV